MPLLAEAIVRVGKALDSSQRLKLYHQFYPVLVSFHQWLYRERDPKQQGLVVQVHPAETALESSPAMMAELDNHPLNWWRKGMHQPSSSSTNNKLNSLVLSSVQQNLRRNGYNNQKILTSKAFAIQDVAFNAVLIRNNQLLKQIASTINQSLPASLLKAIKASQTSFDSLWDPQSNQYCAREFHSNRILTEPSIGGLLALYSSVLSKERSTILVDQLKQSDLFGANFPLSTVPINSSWYQAANINQGAASPVINWLLIDGLLRNGYQQEATVLRHNSLSMISSFGCYEAFNSDSGNGLGAANCASTAAIAIDLMLNPIA